jgi:hypothetical protein
LKLLFIGNTSSPEFAPLLRTARRCVEVDVCESIARSLASSDLLPSADVVALVQSRRGRIAADGVDELRRRWPLTPLVALLGSWCEGEVRTGRPWPGVPRVYWHQFEASLANDLERIAAGKCPSWGLPTTLTTDERFERLAISRVERRSGLIAIRSARHGDFDALADVCRGVGYAVVAVPPGEPVTVRGADAAIWSETYAGNAASEISQLRDSLPTKTLVALLHFPRHDDVQQSLAAGATAVVSKPFMLDALLRELP